MSPSVDRLILEEDPDAIVVTTPRGEIVYWNNAAALLFGHPRAEAIGKNLNELIEPIDPAHHEEIVCDVLDGRLMTYESIRHRKDGSLIYLDVTSKLVHDDAEPLVLHAHKDVTDMKVRRDAKLVEARFRDLLESTPDAIIMVNPAGRIVLANSQAERLFGYERGELGGEPVEILLPESLRELHVGHRARYFSQPRTRAMGAGLELNGLRKDGTAFAVEISLSPLETEEGTLVMSAVRDIGERKKAEQKFRALLESAPDAMVIVDRDGEIVLINSQTEQLFGYTREELVGMTVEALVPERYRGSHSRSRKGFFENPQPRAMGAGLDLYGRRRDGSEFPVEISLSPLETEEGRLVSSAIRDISERKRIENDLYENNIELERAAHAKNRFLATMSHELRTPLNAIIGFTGTLLMKLPGPLTAQQEKQLTTIQGSARHLLALINDLLDLAKIESGTIELKLEPVSCGSVVDEVIETLGPAAERKGLRLEVIRPDGDLTVHADRRALSQIVINLVNNAIKYTNSGRIAVRLKRCTAAEQPAVRIDVEDTGCGISVEDRTRLFQAFSQLDSSSTREHEGTGLGLHLSQQLAALIRGEIRCESEPGHGSTFTLSVPEHRQ